MREQALGSRSDRKREGAKADANGQNDSLYDETCNWRWDIGNDLLLASPGTDHQQIDSRSSWSPDSPSSSEGDGAAAECALGDRRRRSRGRFACFPADGSCPPSKCGPRHREGANGCTVTTADGRDRG